MKTYQFKVPDGWDIENCCFTAFNDGKIKLTRDLNNGIYEMLTVDVKACEESNAIEIGDEVMCGYEVHDTKGIVYEMVDKNIAHVICINKCGKVWTDYVHLKDCIKTGRHYGRFDEIAIFLSQKED